MERYDVVVVGAGCGGSKTAEILAKHGKKVLLLERKEKPGYKVCAGGLTKHCLDLCNFPENVIERRFSKVSIKTPHQTANIEMAAPFMATVDKAAMYEYMAMEAERAGAEVRTNSTVTKIEDDFVVVNDEQEIGFDHLVGADGSSSIVRKHLGLKTEKMLSAFQYIVPERFEDFEVIFDFDKFGAAYAWIFPYKNTTSIGTGGDLSRWGRKFQTVGQIKRNFDKWCRKRFDIRKAHFEGATINYDYRGFKFMNKFLVGDAGGFACGLTGEGKYFSILSGIDVANKILDPEYKTENIDHILNTKRWEEDILRSFEVSKSWTKLEAEAVILLLKNRWFAKRFVSTVD